MNKSYKLLGLGLIALGLAACQSTPRQYNGNVGYQIESKSTDSATLAYTLAIRQNQKVDKQKLQRACQKVLGLNKQYKLTILSISEIANPEIQTPYYGRQLGQSRTIISLSNTPDLYNSENMATRQSLEARPSTLSVVRYTCS
ncbi:hypothetical protein H0920_02010 [Acinetobacter sp. C_4_1]|uniref:hypothetical protein n=1 Tax=unclassified Acinetobacter TaxID=196816 RepID=UPI0021B7BC41|nr:MULTISPECIES: hypothetical protein [unclassified Acinetobacter]MCT8088962.1 hypothetical protein [Acinetobacter sp. F_3_1]MCT8097118.1 hypothetical protein [Acinetobacter sp. C_3_1]MCT8099889.1 hypothetical protein [Acinetobacter sp. C_4_1]MCT8134288.1 hypothetical protein [Acinetobacter sp. T_3_1]